MFAPPENMFLRLLTPIILLMAFSLIGCSAQNYFEYSIKSITLFASFLALLNIFVAIFPDINEYLSPWVSIGDEGVWSQSSLIGRVVGIFNQPLEAGVFFSISLLTAITYSKIYLEKFWLLNLLYVILIIVGGALSLSKIFLILGLFIALLYSVSIKVIRTRSFFVWLLMISILINLLALYAPAYFDSLFDLYENGGFIFALSAGRFDGGESENMLLYLRVFGDLNWISGFGLGSYLPLDSGYLEYLYQGGVCAFLGYLIFILWLFRISLVSWHYLQGKLLCFIVLLIIFGSMGGSVISANRANVVLFLLVASILGSLKYNSIVLNKVKV
jgi:hypothetical protein